jgi:rsbT co-antagonist protein RsbR
MKDKKDQGEGRGTQPPRGANETLLQELVGHFREEREGLRRQWVKQMTGKKLLEGLTPAEVESESVTIYDTCIDCLQTGQYDSAQRYATKMAERGVLRGMSTEQIIGGLLVLRDVYGRSLFERYQRDLSQLSAALDIYEPVGNKILSIVAMAFIEESEKVLVSKQQEAIRELSTPVLQVRDQMLILPIIGVLESVRAKQLTEQLLRSIRERRAKAVVLDITGVPGVDSKVANHLVQTVEAVRLLGATAIITGLSPEVAQTLVAIGVDLSRIRTMGDLQSGIDEADKLLGYTVILKNETAEK